MTDLRLCCQQALLDGTSPRDHYPACDARADDPPEMDALFDLPTPEPQRGPRL